MKTISLSSLTQMTLQTLGKMIRIARKERKISQTNLAERLNVSRFTVIALERGDAQVSIGVVFEAAHIVGIPLLVEDEKELQKLAKTITQFNAILPKKIRSPKRPINDEF